MSKFSRLGSVLAGVLMLGTVMTAGNPAQAAVITTFYGDNDGFGTGLFTGSFSSDPFGVNNASVGEAAFTDRGMISNVKPTGNFASFSISGSIVTATLTARFGSFDPTPPLQNPNILLLDGLDVASLGFFNLFADKTGASGDANNAIETVSLALTAAYFPLLADGNVSLNGTRISEGSNSGSFMIDYLQLTITTAEIPEPGTLAILSISLAGLGFARRKRAA